MKRYFKIYERTPRGAKSSVHRDKFRLNKAEEQAGLSAVGIKDIISYVNEFLESIGMAFVNSPEMSINSLQEIDYKKIKETNKLNDIRDIVWMKFTKDGYLGVVATSNDINFDMPSSKNEYNDKIKGDWRYNTAGILVHSLNKEWDTSFVLVFPLSDIPDCYKRGDIERAIGNYLIDKGVPVIDFYSHNY